MKKILFIAATLCAICCYGQKSTYSGPYKLQGLSDGTTGEATYEYTEVDDERVLEGKFNYEHSNFRGTYKITGIMKNNAPFGQWTFTSEGRKGGSYNIPRITYGKIGNNIVMPGVKTIMIGSYNENGKKNGKWTLTQTCGKYGSKGTAHFTDGYISGDFEASAIALNHSSQKEQKYSLKGQFAEEGLPDSTWVGKWTDDSGLEYLLKITFNKGRFVSLKAKDQSTGQDISGKYSDWMFVNGKYAGQGKKNEGTENLPDIFSQLLGIFLGDPIFLSEEPSPNGMTLDWDR